LTFIELVESAVERGSSAVNNADMTRVGPDLAGCRDDADTGWGIYRAHAAFMRSSAART
jgi:hypothetical protein